MSIPSNHPYHSLSRALFMGLLILNLALLSACGGDGDKAAGQTKVTISIAQRLVAMNEMTPAPSTHRGAASLAGTVLDTLIRQAHAVSFAENFPFLGQVTLQINGTGFTSASINADFNDNTFTLTDDGSALLLLDTDVSLTVPDTVDLTFIVTAFNLEGFRIFRGTNTLTVNDLLAPSVSLPIPLMVDIDERIPRLVAGTGCDDDDDDGICSVFEDVFVNQSGVPDIDGDGMPNSEDTNSDGDQLDDATEGLTASNDGFPVFIHRNQQPTSASVSIEISGSSGSGTPQITDPDTGDSHTLQIVTPPANGTATVQGNQIVYTANSGFNGSDSFTFSATDIGGLSRQGTANVSVSGNTTPPLSLAELIELGLTALDNEKFLEARGHFETANELAGTDQSPDADAARFFFAISRVTALGFDTLSDGNATEMDRLGDMLDAFGFASDNQTRDDWNLIEIPDTLPTDSPAGNDVRDFLYDVVRPELLGAITNLNQVSQSFNLLRTDPIDDTEVENDFGDVLFFKGTFNTMLTWIAIQRAYNLETDIDATVNPNHDTNPDNDTKIQSFIALPANDNFLKLADTAKLAEAKAFMLSALDAFAAAIDEMDAETDDQFDDFITLDGGTVNDANDLADAKDYIADIKNSVMDAGNLIDQNDKDPDNDYVLELDRFFDIGIDFRSPNRLPPFSDNAISDLFPDPTFNGVIFEPDLSEDVDPQDSIPDVTQ